MPEATSDGRAHRQSPVAASVIVPVWNGKDHLQRCLSSLRSACRQTDFTTELIFVDNASDDGSAKWLAEQSDVEVLCNRENLGFAGGCNVGMKAARGDTLVLLNQDTEVDPEWLTELVAGTHHAEIVGSLAFLGDGVSIQHAGGIVDWPLGIARHHGYGETVTPEWLQPAEVDFVTGASMAISRKVVERIGFLDEAFWPGYYEDTDYCFRARDAGFRILYWPDSRLIHQEHASYSDPLISTWARLRGRLRFCLKHLPFDRFVNEFLSAEQQRRSQMAEQHRPAAVARAYLEMIPAVLDAWQQEPGERRIPPQIHQTVQALAELYAPAPHRLPVESLEDQLATLALAPRVKPVLAPSRLDHIPVLGPLWTPVRRALHRLVIFYVERRQLQLQETIRIQADVIHRLKQKSSHSRPQRRREDAS